MIYNCTQQTANHLSPTIEKNMKATRPKPSAPEIKLERKSVAHLILPPVFMKIKNKKIRVLGMLIDDITISDVAGIIHQLQSTNGHLFLPKQLERIQRHLIRQLEKEGYVRTTAAADVKEFTEAMPEELMVKINYIPDDAKLSATAEKTFSSCSNGGFEEFTRDLIGAPAPVKCHQFLVRKKDGRVIAKIGSEYSLGTGAFGNVKLGQIIFSDLLSENPLHKPEFVVVKAQPYDAERKSLESKFGKGETIHCSKNPKKIRFSHSGKSAMRSNIVFDLAPGESLNGDSSKMRANFNDSQYLQFMVNACKALAAFAKKGFIHRDIKTCNTMIFLPTQEVYLVDFGIVVEADEKKEHRPGAGVLAIGPVPCMPMEVFNATLDLSLTPIYSQKGDVYGLAILIAEVLDLTKLKEKKKDDLSDYIFHLVEERIMSSPFKDKVLLEKIYRILENVVSNENYQERPTADALADEFEKLLKLHLKDNPKNIVFFNIKDFIKATIVDNKIIQRPRPYHQKLIADAAIGIDMNSHSDLTHSMLVNASYLLSVPLLSDVITADEKKASFVDTIVAAVIERRQEMAHEEYAVLTNEKFSPIDQIKLDAARVRVVWSVDPVIEAKLEGRARQQKILAIKEEASTHLFQMVKNWFNLSDSFNPKNLMSELVKITHYAEKLPSFAAFKDKTLANLSEIKQHPAITYADSDTQEERDQKLELRTYVYFYLAVKEPLTRRSMIFSDKPLFAEMQLNLEEALEPSTPAKKLTRGTYGVMFTETMNAAAIGPAAPPCVSGPAGPAGT